jgi:uncharacterized membrane protein (DUF2068 family)
MTLHKNLAVLESNVFLPDGVYNLFSEACPFRVSETLLNLNYEADE